MASTEHRCPQCGHIAGIASRVLVPIGRPFLECMGCRGFVERTPYREWTGLAGIERLQVFARGALLALSSGVLSTFVCWLALGRDSSSSKLLAMLLIACAAALAIWVVLLGNAISHSNRRMLDPMYRARLAEFEMSQIQAKATP